MLKKIIKICGCGCLVIILATGCRPAPRPVPQNPAVPPAEERMDRQGSQDPMTPQDRVNDPVVGQEATIRADRIVNEIARLEEVKSATVVITGNTALVGVNLTSDIQGEMTTETKRKIEDVVRRTDRQIDRVSVTADPEIFSRIENIVRETGRGKPLSGFGKEIEDLIRRITPGA